MRLERCAGREFPINDLVKLNCARVFEGAYQEMILGFLEAPQDQYKKAYTTTLERLEELASI